MWLCHKAELSTIGLLENNLVKLLPGISQLYYPTFMLLISTLVNNLCSVYSIIFLGTDWMWWWLDRFERRYWRCWEDSSFKWSYWKSGFVVRPERYHQVTFTLDFLIGKIGILVPQLWSEGQLHPSTFKLANIVPQLLFVGQTRPYVDIILHNNIIILHNNMRFMQKVLLPLAPSPLNSATVYFFTKKIFNQCKSHSVVASMHLEAEQHKCLIWNIEVYLPMHCILLRTHWE
jgi:hypothetical protein